MKTLRREFLVATSLWLTAASALAVAEELPTFRLEARDGRFQPETFEVPSGKRFKLVIRNHGPDPIEFESLELRKEKVLAPGAQSFVVIAPLKPGRYQFFDEFHPDTARGYLEVK